MTTLGGTTLGGAAAKKKPANKKKGGSKPAPAAGTALGTPPEQATGGTPTTEGGAAPTPAPAATQEGGTALGASPAQGGGGTALGGTALGGTPAAKKKPAKKKPKKPAASSAEPAPAGGASSDNLPKEGESEPAAVTTTSEDSAPKTEDKPGGTAQGGTALGGTALGGSGGSAAANKKKGKKKKGPAKPVDAPATGDGETPAEPAAEKPSAGGKKPEKGRKGISKAMAARILQQKEEQRLRELEEARLAEEEARKELERIEEEKRKEEEKRLLRIKQKEERKKRKEEQARLDKERKKMEHLARYGIKVAPKTGEAPKKKSQSEMYKNLSKGKGKGRQPGDPKSPDSSPQTQRAETSSPVQDEEEDTWESQADEPTEPNGEKEKIETEVQPPVDAVSTEKEEPQKGRRELRSPICCILGHVDVGKTKLLDKIRHTNVQGGEAGGITQQIGATYFPLETLQEKTKQLLEGTKFNIRVPGLLIIDTPGHESFTNLRSRGSGLCDIAILVVDLMHGIEQQTKESIQLLKMRKTPFIVALNKVDRIFSWKATPDAPFVQSLKKQTKSVVQEFETRVLETVAQFAAEELNAVLYYKNEDFSKYVSLVPTSAHTGEGIPDLLALLVKLTQTKMTAKITTLSTFQATVLEVKIVEGLGTTIDVILSNGVLHEGDKIVICGLEGPIVTTIRALLTPHPLRELRVKTPYLHHKEVKAAQGIKIAAHGLEKAVAGSSLYVVGPDDSEEELKKQVQGELTDMLSKVSKRGVCVQASTLGSLEALLTFLESSKIPVGAINLGPIHRADVMRAAVNLGDEKGKRKEYGTILAFDVKVTKEARDEAQKTGVKIFTADIIYHLFDQFTAYVDQIKKEERDAAMAKAIFPVSIEILPDCIFNQKEPILVGVRVKEGVLRIGTPLCINKVNEEENAKNKRIIRFIGKVTGIEENRKAVNEARTGQEVAVKIEGGGVLYGRHFDYTDELFSQLTRESIDVLKQYFRDMLKDSEIIALIKKQKETLGIL